MKKNTEIDVNIMPQKKIYPYGGWPSSISASSVIADTISIGQLCLDGPDIYWNEVRPKEKGRSIVCKLGKQKLVEDFSPPNANVRSRVHEYGGGAYIVENGELWFSDGEDGRVWHKSFNGNTFPITSKSKSRYADFVRDSSRGRLIAIAEDHQEIKTKPNNRLVAIRETGDVNILAEGADFYSSPKVSADGRWLSWLSWDHPCMPWDGTSLWLAPIATDGAVGEQVLVAGGSKESIFQPEFAPDGTLYFVSDRSGWWNLYRIKAGEIELVLALDAECGVPQWSFGLSTYGFASENVIVISYIVDGLSKLAVFDLSMNSFCPIHSSFVDITGLKVGNGQAIFVGGSLVEPNSIVSYSLKSKKMTTLYRSGENNLSSSDVSRPIPVSIPVGDGEKTNGFFYKPQNALCIGSPDTLPPLIVKCHGGPTGQASAAFNFKIQFWTNRGFAVFDVNYRGSSGFGKSYRNRIRGEWGLVDVEDCVSGAKWLAEKGWVDGERMAISGSSAGGYTTLCALTFENCFAAGASYYGIGDLSALAKETHKFESKYLDSLIGAWPEEKALYSLRSPINFTEKLSCPLILFQGLKDKIVPPSQAEDMVAALQKKGIPIAYLSFIEEGHGFRQSKNIIRSIESELDFYGQVFRFRPAGEIASVLIENISGLGGERNC